MGVTQVTNRLIGNAAVTGVKLNVLTTPGDIMDYTTVAGRKTVGADGTVLIADSTQTDGLRWGANVATAFQSLSSDPGSPAGGAVWYNTTTGTDKTETVYGIGTVVTTIFVNTATSAAVVNTAAETLFNQNISIPANALTTGSTLHLQAYGNYSDTVANTLEFKIKLGSTVVIDSQALTAVTGSNKQWNMEGFFTITASGSSGTLNGAGSIGIGQTGANAGIFTALATNGVAINTTIANILGISVQWGTAQANDTISMAFLHIEVLQ